MLQGGMPFALFAQVVTTDSYATGVMCWNGQLHKIVLYVINLVVELCKLLFVVKYCMYYHIYTSVIEK